MKTLLALLTAGCWLGVAVGQAADLSSSRPAPGGTAGPDDGTNAAIHSQGALSLDPTFGASRNGKVTTTVGQLTSEPGGRALAIQPDGKIVVVGWANRGFALVRYTADGYLDSSFGASHTGKVITPIGSGSSYALAVALQPRPDGSSRIIAVGSSWRAELTDDFAVVGYTANGYLDTTFGASHTGKVTTAIGSGSSYALAVALQPQADGNNKIVVAGSAYPAGSEDFALVRYTADGFLDPFFGMSFTGRVTTDFALSRDRGLGIAVQPDRKIVVVGSSAKPGLDEDFAVARYLAQGRLDTSTFGVAGKVTTPIGTGDDIANAVAIQPQPDGSSKIIAVGESFNGHNTDFALVRYNTNGSIDTSFGEYGTGKVTTSFAPAGACAMSVAIHPTDRGIVVAGYSYGDDSHADFALVHYDPDGRLVDRIITEFGVNTWDYGLGVALQPPDNRIVVAGTSGLRFAAVRYTGGPGTGVTVTVDPTQVAEDGSEVLTYTFSRSTDPSSVLPINFSVGGTATYNTDYTTAGALSFSATSGTVSIPAGQITAQVVVRPRTDTVVERNETVVLTVLPGSDYEVGTPSAATGTIYNDDQEVTVTVAPAAVQEDGTTHLVFTFTRTRIGAMLRVYFSVGGTATYNTDYTQLSVPNFSATSGSVRFTSGETQMLLTVRPRADTVAEPDETVILTLLPGPDYRVGTPSTATGTIQTDDGPTVTVTVNPVRVQEGQSQELVYTFERSATTGGAMTVSFGVGGTATYSADYTATGAESFSATSGTVRFGASQTTARVRMRATADTVVEPDETVVLTVTGGTGYSVGDPSAATGTIRPQ